MVGLLMRKMRTGREGQALVEMAIAILVLLIIVMGGAEVARLAHVALVVTNAAREGARVAAIGKSYAEVASTVQRSLGSWAKGSHTIEITPGEQERRQGEPVQVRVLVPVPLITPILSSILSDPFPVQSTVVMRAE